MLALMYGLVYDTGAEHFKEPKEIKQIETNVQSLDVFHFWKEAFRERSLFRE